MSKARQRKADPLLAPADEILAEYFGPTAGHPCWDVRAEYGTWLNMEFGNPRLRILTTIPDANIKYLRPRTVLVVGDFSLQIEMGAWELRGNGKRLYHSNQSRSFLRKAAFEISGQLLVAVEIRKKPLLTVFQFELGGKLVVSRHVDAEPDNPLWHIYANGNCMSLLANGELKFGKTTSPKRRRVKVLNAKYVVPPGMEAKC